MRKILAAAMVIIAMSTAVLDSATGAGLNATIVNPFHAYSYGDMLKDAEALQSMYPQLIRLDAVGGSVEGRKLLLIRFGIGKRNIFIDGTMHANEYISASYLMYMLDQYAQAYETTGTFGDFNPQGHSERGHLLHCPDGQSGRRRPCPEWPRREPRPGRGSVHGGARRTVRRLLRLEGQYPGRRSEQEFR